jgi:hypothetical protein
MRGELAPLADRVSARRKDCTAILIGRYRRQTYDDPQSLTQMSRQMAIEGKKCWISSYGQGCKKIYQR